LRYLAQLIDGRISLASSNTHFLNVCQQLYQQAIDTVPSGVSMQDVSPQEVKPVNVRISVSSSGAVTFSGAIRVSLDPVARIQYRLTSSPTAPWHAVRV
jgi:hypothetical protein